MKQIKSIDKEIISYLGKLSDKEKKAVLTVVKTFAEDTLSLWDIMPEEVRDGVERGLKQSKKGEGTSHSEVMKTYEKWLKK
jgi:predicted transcriptional regulator